MSQETERFESTSSMDQQTARYDSMLDEQMARCDSMGSMDQQMARCDSMGSMDHQNSFLTGSQEIPEELPAIPADLQPLPITYREESAYVHIAEWSFHYPALSRLQTEPVDVFGRPVVFTVLRCRIAVESESPIPCDAAVEFDIRIMKGGKAYASRLINSWWLDQNTDSAFVNMPTDDLEGARGPDGNVAVLVYMKMAIKPHSLHIFAGGAGPGAPREAGLENQGATCYLNAFLQSVFHITEFRDKIYSFDQREVLERAARRYTAHVDDTEAQLDTEPFTEKLTFLPSLQKLFCDLQIARAPCSTEELTRSFGWERSEELEQQDIHELIRLFFDHVEKCLKETELKNLIKELMSFEVDQYVKCRNVDFTSTTKQELYDLEVAVPLNQPGDLLASLATGLLTDALDESNKFDTGKPEFGCQDADKGILYHSFSPVLMFHLKRFEFDVNSMEQTKLNTRVSYGDEIDMGMFSEVYAVNCPKCSRLKLVERGKERPSSPDEEVCGDPTSSICVTHTYESNKYRLHSVMVHKGTARVGHYFAYVRIDDRWVRFDDTDVYAVHRDAVFSASFGKQSWVRRTTELETAYILVYVKSDMYSQLIYEHTEARVPEPLTSFCNTMHEQKERLQQVMSRKLARRHFHVIKANDRRYTLDEETMNKLLFPYDSTIDPLNFGQLFKAMYSSVESLTIELDSEEWLRLSTDDPMDAFRERIECADEYVFFLLRGSGFDTEWAELKDVNLAKLDSRVIHSVVGVPKINTVRPDPQRTKKQKLAREDKAIALLVCCNDIGRFHLDKVLIVESGATVADLPDVCPRVILSEKYIYRESFMRVARSNPYEYLATPTWDTLEQLAPAAPIVPGSVPRATLFVVDREHPNPVRYKIEARSRLVKCRYRNLRPNLFPGFTDGTLECCISDTLMNLRERIGEAAGFNPSNLRLITGFKEKDREMPIDVRLSSSIRSHHDDCFAVFEIYVEPHVFEWSDRLLRLNQQNEFEAQSYYVFFSDEGRTHKFMIFSQLEDNCIGHYLMAIEEAMGNEKCRQHSLDHGCTLDVSRFTREYPHRRRLTGSYYFCTYDMHIRNEDFRAATFGNHWNSRPDLYVNRKLPSRDPFTSDVYRSKVFTSVTSTGARHLPSFAYVLDIMLGDIDTPCEPFDDVIKRFSSVSGIPYDQLSGKKWHIMRRTAQSPDRLDFVDRKEPITGTREISRYSDSSYIIGVERAQPQASQGQMKIGG